MPAHEDCRIFISYAHHDGGALAERLQHSLRLAGLDAWLDTERITGGATWTTAIEAVLDQSDVVLALLTRDSYTSDICRAEQLRSLRKGKCVIPILAEKNADIPLHLEPRNYRDFTDPVTYQDDLKSLLADIATRNGAMLQDNYRDTYVTAPPLPAKFVERNEELAALRATLITDARTGDVPVTALQGMGGIGKTVLAQALCHDEVVRQAFPDGIIWVTVGRESPYDVVTRLREVGKALKDDLTRYDNELGCRNQYRSTIRSRAALIVIDDVWKTSDIEPFRADASPRSRLLFTTRDASIAAAVGAREHTVDFLTVEQSREMLAKWSGLDSEAMPRTSEDLIRECGRLPLALSMTGAMLRSKPAVLWRRTLDLIRNADLAKIRTQFPDYPHPNLLRAIQVSVDALDPTARDRYLALAVLLEEMSIDPVIQQTLWNVDEGEALETAEQLIDLSLAQRAGEGIRLHTLQVGYVRAQHPDRNALRLINEAVRLSSHVIGKDAVQFASQMVGRLLAHQSTPGIKRFLAGVIEGSPAPWVRPLRPTLHPPGTSLIRTLSGHAGAVNAVSVSADGRVAVSASYDKTLKVWDVENGRELHSLVGHSEPVCGVAMSLDGRRAISASYDKTLKVWDVERGRELHKLTGHTSFVESVAASADGRRAVSASHDHTLKVWDVDSGRELHSLIGHSDVVTGVAVSADGQRAVSTSKDSTLKVWDLESGCELRTLEGHTAPGGVAMSADGRRALSGSWDNSLRVWDLESGRELRKLAGHSFLVFAVAMSADGQLGVSASFDNMLKVWDLERGCELLSLEGSYVHGVAVSAVGQRVVSASWDSTLKVWDLEAQRGLGVAPCHSGAVFCVAVSADGRRVVSASLDHTLKVWDVDSGGELRSLTGHTHAVRSVALSADGTRAVSTSWDQTLRVWDVDSGRELRRLAGCTHFPECVAISADGRLAVSASYDKKLKVWNLDSGCELRSLIGHSEWVCAVAVSADGRRAVSASHDHTLKVWDVDTGRELHSLIGHSHFVTGVAVSADGQRAVSASSDNTLKVWDLERGQELRSLDPAAFCYKVGVSADGRRAVSASHDRTLKIWDLQNGAAVATFSCDVIVYCCAFVGENKIVAGDAGGGIHFFFVDESDRKKRHEDRSTSLLG